MRNMQILSRDSDRSNTVGCNIAMFIVQVYSYFGVASGFRMRCVCLFKSSWAFVYLAAGAYGRGKGEEEDVEEDEKKKWK